MVPSVQENASIAASLTRDRRGWRGSLASAAVLDSAPPQRRRSPPISPDLFDLVKRCGDGDPEAWRAFLSPLQQIGRRALRSFRLPPADADDILADALAS